MLEEISEEFKKVKEKQKITQSEINGLFDVLENDLMECEKSLNEINSKGLNEEDKKKEFLKVLENTSKTIKGRDFDNNFNSMTNGYYASLSKLGKVINKIPEVNYDDYRTFPMNKKLFQEVKLLLLFFRLLLKIYIEEEI